MTKRTRPLTIAEMQQALQRLEGHLPEDAYAVLQDVVASYSHIGELLSDETMTAERLRKTLRRRRRPHRNAEINKTPPPQTPPPPRDGGPAAHG